MAATVNQRAGQFKALGHPVRLRIACGLLRHQCQVGRIVSRLGLPQSTVSQHLGILRRAGVIVPERHGVRVCYRIADRDLARLLARLVR